LFQTVRPKFKNRDTSKNSFFFFFMFVAGARALANRMVSFLFKVLSSPTCPSSDHDDAYEMFKI